MKSIKKFFDIRHAQTWQIICESSSEEQVTKQFSLFMYSIYEKLQELCPIIKELIADDGIQRRVQGGGGSGTNLFGGGSDSRDLGQVSNAQLE